jgi:hypothetical protein
MMIDAQAHFPVPPRFVIPAKAGIQRPLSSLGSWIPAFAGMTRLAWII